MTITTLRFKLAKKFKFLYRSYEKKIISELADKDSSAKLNQWYNKLGNNEKSRFQRLFAKMYRENTTKIAGNIWNIDFMGSPVALPLRSEHAWLDWDMIVSIIGHDLEVKATYENLIASGNIKVFFDLGANYGTHSLLFLVKGIQTVSFEPIASLKKEFDLYCLLNNVKGKMETAAIGDKTGVVDLWFKEDETWNASIVKGVEDKKNKKMIKLEVPLITIDGYVADSGLIPGLMKIDTEGNELNVLNGARDTIVKGRPLIIFETNSFKERPELWSFFQGVSYHIQKLPYDPNVQPKPIDKSYFLKSGANNYIAVPENQDK